MPATVLHAKVSLIPDDPDDSLVRPTDWNAGHVVELSVLPSEISLLGPSILGRYDTGTGVSQSITLGSGISLSSMGVLSATGSGGTVTSVAATGANGITVTGSPITGSGTLAFSLGAITPTSVAASGTLSGSNFSGSSSGTNTGDQTISVVSANGFGGTVALPISAPAITITTSVNGIVKGNGTALSSAVAGVDYEVPLTFSTGLTRTTNTITVNTSQNIATLSNLTTNGFVKTNGGTGALSIDTNTYLTGNQTITLSGDVSGSGATAITATLATVNSNVGTFGSATQVPQFTVNGKGLITAASNVTITGVTPGGSAGGDLTGTYPNPTIGANKVTNAQIATRTALSIMGNSVNTVANVGDIIAVSDNTVFRRSGSALGFGAIDLSQSNTVGSSKLGLGNGGANADLSAVADGSILFKSGTAFSTSASLTWNGTYLDSVFRGDGREITFQGGSPAPTYIPFTDSSGRLETSSELGYDLSTKELFLTASSANAVQYYVTNLNAGATSYSGGRWRNDAGKYGILAYTSSVYTGTGLGGAGANRFMVVNEFGELFLGTAPFFASSNIGAWKLDSSNQITHYRDWDGPTRHIIKNADSTSNAYCELTLRNNGGSGLRLSMNSSGRSGDGGTNGALIWNDSGNLTLRNSTGQECGLFGANFGFGTSSPVSAVHVLGASSSSSSEVGSFIVGGGTTARRLAMGVDATGTMYSWIQSVESGVNVRDLVLQPVGGNVGIGVTPSANLHIYKSSGDCSQLLQAGSYSLITGANSAGYGYIGTYSNVLVNFVTNNTNRMTIYATGDTAIYNSCSIGTSSAPNSAAILDLTSTTKAFLPPRMTTTQKNAISSPPAGSVVFDTTLAKLCVSNGTTWETVTSI